MATNQQVVKYGFAFKQLCVLKRSGNAQLSYTMSGYMRDVFTAKGDPPMRCVVDSADEIKDRGFTRSIWTDNGKNFTRVNLKTHFLDSLNPTEVHRYRVCNQEAQCKRSVRKNVFCRL